MFLGTVTSFAYEISMLFWLPNYLFWWWDVRTVERWMLKDAGDWVYTMVSWTLRGFVCTRWVVRWRGMNVSGVVVGESTSVLGGRRVCGEVVWFVWPACGWRHVTWTWSCDARRFTRRVGGLVEWCLSIFACFGLFEYFDQGSSFRYLYSRVDCECNRPSFLATVFYNASAFNGDLSRWDVATVTDMFGSKSTRLVENDLTWRELMLLWLEGSVGGLGLVVVMWCRDRREVVLKNAWDWVHSHGLL